MIKDNQPTCEINSLGTKRWILNGQLHREDGPAIEWSGGSKFWYFYGQLHRLDGPAVIRNDDSTESWWYHGCKINCSSQEEFERLIKLKALW